MAAPNHLKFSVPSLGEKASVPNKELQRVLGKIGSFLKLQPGWHFGEGCTPSDVVVSVANSIATFAVRAGVMKIDAFPGTDGEITVALYIGGVDHSFEVQRSSLVNYWIETDSSGEALEGLALDRVFSKIVELTSPLTWNSPSYFTYSTGTKLMPVLGAWHFGTPATEVEYRVYRTNALSKHLVVSVYTPVASIRPLHLSLQSSGNSTNRSFPPAMD